MTCAEFIRELYGDLSDLSACEAHLRNCSKCARAFSDEVRLEKSLRKLPSLVHPVDISGDIITTITNRQNRTKKLGATQKAIWIMTSLAVIISALMAIPYLADLFITNLSLHIKASSTIAMVNIQKFESTIGFFGSLINWQILCVIVAIFAASLIVLLQSGKNSEDYRLG